MAKQTSTDPTVRTSLTVRKSMADAIERYRNERGLLTTADAQRELIQASLDRARPQGGGSAMGNFSDGGGCGSHGVGGRGIY